jgi:EpsI family protein
MNAKSTVLVAAAMCVAGVAGALGRPSYVEEPNFLEATVPAKFSDWRKLDEGPQIVDPGTAAKLKEIYKETLSGTYVDGSGYRIMLSIARSGNQIGIQEAHRPEVCYPAQGFTVIGKVEEGALTTPYGPIEVERLTTSLGPRVEPITYWLTMADRVVRTRWDKRVVQFTTAFTGQAPGGLLFRVSSIERDSQHAFAMQQKFVTEMMESVSADARRRLSGLTSLQP